MSSKQLSKSRRTLLLVLAAFIIPVVLAKFALDQQWFNKGVTNKGTLLTNQITLDKMGLSADSFEKKWLMLYLLPEQCQQQCQQTLHSVNNTYIALGKESERVQPIALTHQDLTVSQRQLIKEKSWAIQSMPAQTSALFKDSQILIVDTLGNIILTYIPPKKESAQPLFGKAILADLKKLLKYSKIG